MKAKETPISGNGESLYNIRYLYLLASSWQVRPLSLGDVNRNCFRSNIINLSEILVVIFVGTRVECENSNHCINIYVCIYKNAANSNQNYFRLTGGGCIVGEIIINGWEFSRRVSKYCWIGTNLAGKISKTEPDLEPLSLETGWNLTARFNNISKNLENITMKQKDWVNLEFEGL